MAAGIFREGDDGRSGSDGGGGGGGAGVIRIVPPQILVGLVSPLPT